MELPFAVESPSGNGAENPVGRNSSLQHSESSSLVTASSQGSFMNSSNNNLNIADHCSPLIPNTPQDILLPSPHHAQSQHQQQGQLVVTPASQERNISMKDGGYGDPENDFTYVNVTEIDADEDDILLERAGLSLPQDQARGDILAVLLSGMQQSESGSLLVRKKREKN